MSMNVKMRTKMKRNYDIKDIGLMILFILVLFYAKFMAWLMDDESYLDNLFKDKES